MIAISEASVPTIPVWSITAAQVALSSPKSWNLGCVRIIAQSRRTSAVDFPRLSVTIEHIWNLVVFAAPESKITVERRRVQERQARMRTVLGRVRLQRLGASGIAERMQFDALDERMILRSAQLRGNNGRD
jgi:hypothetical protein